MRCLLCLLLACSYLDAATAPQFGREDEAVIDVSPAMAGAINRGLAWLARNQQTDGSWTGQYGKNVGEVSLALLAFMALGNLPGEGEYGAVVGRGVNWILAQSQPNGLIQYTAQSQQAGAMYGHALATLLLSEAWGQTRHQQGAADIGNVLRRAVDLIVQVQGPRGGWGYNPVPDDGDNSIVVMQIVALKSAQEAGIYVPELTIQRALRLVQSRYNPKERGYGYRNDRFNLRHFGSSAAGTCVHYICGVDNDRFTKHPLERAFAVAKDDDQFRQTGRWGTYWLYYASVSAYIDGPETFANWVPLLEPRLLSLRRGDNWGRGAAYATGFAILAAALPYRYLPIYQR